jgi:NAD(P) transhydrogenase subunit beta
MTAMPQMVALFNGVGGGAVALISVVEFPLGAIIELRSLIPILSRRSSARSRSGAPTSRS